MPGIYFPIIAQAIADSLVVAISHGGTTCQRQAFLIDRRKIQDSNLETKNVQVLLAEND